VSLIGALNLGKAGLAAQQAALQVTGNNISNAGNENYTREVANLSPSADQQITPGVFIGTGVDLTGITRQVDEALNSRLRSATSDSSGAQTTQQWLSQVEATFNELGKNDLSSRLDAFFSSWSTLASSPQTAGNRTAVISAGQQVASFFGSVRNQLTSLETDINTQITQLTTQANSLAQQVADLNKQINLAEGGGTGQANNLRDKRDAALNQLSQLVGITTVQGDNGSVNVFIGSQPLVDGVTNNGLKLQQTIVNGQPLDNVVVNNTNIPIDTSTGTLGALITTRSQQIDPVINQVDQLAANLIFEVNKVYSAGQGLVGATSITSTNAVQDPTLALNDPAAGLAFVPKTGSFTIHVGTTAASIHIDLDGLNGDDTTLNSLAAQLNSITDLNNTQVLTATVTGGKLTIKSNDPTQQITFTDAQGDSSNVLAALGINTFFTGHNANDIAVNQTVANTPSLLAASANGDGGNGQIATRLATLQDTKLAALSGNSLSDSYQNMITNLAVAASSAQNNAQASAAVQQTLQTQRDSLSGVSMDEEAVNMIQQQRAYQASARFITAVDQMMQTLLQM